MNALNKINKWPNILLLLITTALLFRYPSLLYPFLDIDEVMWGIFAEAVVDGHAPYTHVMGEKGPLLYLSYALIFKLFGTHNYLALHVLAIFWTAGTAFFIYQSCQLLSKKTAHSISLVAALLYIIFSNAPGFRMLSTSGELLMNLPLVLSTYCFLVYLNKDRKKEQSHWIFYASVLVVIATCYRQQSFIQFFLFCVSIFFLSPSQKAKAYLALISGTCLSLLTVFLYLYFSGSLEAFYFWTVSHNVSYINSGFANKNVLWNFTKNSLHILAFTLPLWIFAFSELFSQIKKSSLGTTRSTRFIALYFTFSLIAAFPGGRFFPHYFLQSYPALCILAALYLFRSESKMTFRFKQSLIYIFIVINLIKLPFTGYEMQLGSTQDYSRAHAVVGKHIQENSQVHDTIFIWGWSQGLYYYSRRKPGSRFISTDFLTGRSPSQDDQSIGDTSDNQTPGAWKMLMQDLQERQPQYIIDTSPGNHHGYAKYPMKNYPLLMEYISKNYKFEIHLEGMDLYVRVTTSESTVVY